MCCAAYLRHGTTRTDNKTAFVKNLIDVNEGMDFVSAHMGGIDDRAARPWLAAEGSNKTTPAATVLLEVARATAAAAVSSFTSAAAVSAVANAATRHAGLRQQPFYLGEYTATVNSTTGARSYQYAEGVLEWQLDVDERFGNGGGVLTSLWVFE